MDACQSPYSTVYTRHIPIFLESDQEFLCKIRMRNAIKFEFLWNLFWFSSNLKSSNRIILHSCCWVVTTATATKRGKKQINCSNWMISVSVCVCVAFAEVYWSRQFPFSRVTQNMQYGVRQRLCCLLQSRERETRLNRWKVHMLCICVGTILVLPLERPCGAMFVCVCVRECAVCTQLVPIHCLATWANISCSIAAHFYL